MVKNQNPCQKEACDLQSCIQKNQFQQEKCQGFIKALKECCIKIMKEGKSSPCCPKKVDGLQT